MVLHAINAMIIIIYQSIICLALQIATFQSNMKIKQFHGNVKIVHLNFQIALNVIKMEAHAHYVQLENIYLVQDKVVVVIVMLNLILIQIIR